MSDYLLGAIIGAGIVLAYRELIEWFHIWNVNRTVDDVLAELETYSVSVYSDDGGATW